MLKFLNNAAKAPVIFIYPILVSGGCGLPLNTENLKQIIQKEIKFSFPFPIWPKRNKTKNSN